MNRQASGSGSPRTVTTGGDPAATSRGTPVRSGIHPQYVETQVTCGCGNTFATRSTKTSGSIHVEVCSACHPFYTGKQKILDSGGRVARFEARYGRRPARSGS
jgi:large subunit ribosomal protein L31